MRRHPSPTRLQLGLVCALIGLPATLLAQQDQPGAVLPPPSLYDSPPPPGEAGAVTVPPVTAPVAPVPRAEQPVAVEPPRATPAPLPSTAAPVTPAPSTAPAATPAPRTVQPVTPAPVSPQPAARAAEPASGAGDPWYRRWWDSMTGRAGGGTGQQKGPAAPVVQPEAAAATAAPAALDEGYVSSTPGQVVRSSASGQCVKTGEWTEADERACNAARAAANVAPAPPRPVSAEPPPAPRTPVAQSNSEPVEVRPLAAPQLKPELTLETDRVAVIQRPAPVPAPTPPRIREPAPDKVTLSADTLFALDSYKLRPNARETLDELVARLHQVDFESIKITGHTDPTGAAALNHRLSRQRAEEVRRYLIAHGVSADKIRAEGVGSNMPMVIERDCATLPRPKKVACYQPDRRVDIEVLGATERLAKQ